jgi:hypothetical protein
MSPLVENVMVVMLGAVALVLAFNLLLNIDPAFTGFYAATSSPTADVNVTIISAASITITAGADINLGTLFLGDSNTTANQQGIIIENNGSIAVDLNAYSTTAFFTGTGKPADHNFLGCKVSNSEATSATLVATTYRNCYNTGSNGTLMATAFGYASAADELRMDLNIFVPTDEPAGLKQAVLTLKATASS